MAPPRSLPHCMTVRKLPPNYWVGIRSPMWQCCNLRPTTNPSSRLNWETPPNFASDSMFWWSAAHLDLDLPSPVELSAAWVLEWLCLDHRMEGLCRRRLRSIPVIVAVLWWIRRDE